MRQLIFCLFANFLDNLMVWKEKCSAFVIKAPPGTGRAFGGNEKMRDRMRPRKGLGAGRFLARVSPPFYSSGVTRGLPFPERLTR